MNPEQPPHARYAKEQSHDPSSAKPRLAPPRWKVLGNWTSEIVSTIFAVGLLLAMIIIIGRQNNRRVDSWNFPLGFNTLIALLSTVYRSIVVAVAAEVISQSKWEFFWSAESPQSLIYLDRFDSASRGIWGTTKFLPVAFRRNPMAMLSSLIVLLSFAVGPFVQQSISIADRTFPLTDAMAFIPISQSVLSSGITYSSFLPVSFQDVQDIDADVVSKILSMLLSPRSSDWDIKPSCTSGNCKFPNWNSGSILEEQSSNGTCDITHASVGICSTCFNVTSLIQSNGHRNGPPMYWLPTDNNAYIEDGSGPTFPRMDVHTFQNWSWAESVISAEEMKKLSWSFTNITILAFSNKTQDTGVYQPVAYACSLYPCLRSYCGSVDNNQLSEKLLKTEPLYPELVSVNKTAYPFSKPNTGNLAAIQSPCLINDTVYITSNFSSYPDTEPVQIKSPIDWPDSPLIQVPSQCLYKMDGVLQPMFSNFFSERVFNATCTQRHSTSQYYADCTALWITQFYSASDGGLANISGIFDDFSESVTKEFRLGLGKDESAMTQVRGVSYDTKALYITQWKWLSFPIIFMAIEIAVFLWAVTRSIRQRGVEMVWKSSMLPMVYYRDRFVGANGESIGGAQRAHAGYSEQDTLMTVTEMERDAKGVRTILLRGNGWSSHEGKSEQGLVRVRDMDSDSLLEVER